MKDVLKIVWYFGKQNRFVHVLSHLRLAEMRHRFNFSVISEDINMWSCLVYRNVLKYWDT